MDAELIVSKVVTLFLVLLVGTYLSKRKIITEEVTNKLSTLLINVAMPMLIVSSFNFDFDREMLYNAGMVFVGSVIAHVLAMLISQLVYRKYPSRLKGVLKFCTVFSNCGFMGYPVLESIYGQIGIFYGSIFIIPFHIFSLSYGIIVFTGQDKKNTFKNLKKILTHPGIIAVAIGMVLFLFSIRLPGPIQEATEMVGSLNSPLAMIIVGALLAKYKLREIIKGFPIYLASLMRLIVVPLLLYGIMRFINMSGDAVSIVVVLSAMPAAANAVLFAERYGGDSGLASRCVGVSTILSIATIPLFIMLLT
ncbi:MAG TPA: AEC family transporter [Bacillota bacterium]|nr:AEC family transporter [Bacillota bacterium]